MAVVTIKNQESYKDFLSELKNPADLYSELIDAYRSRELLRSSLVEQEIKNRGIHLKFEKFFSTALKVAHGSIADSIREAVNA